MQLEFTHHQSAHCENGVASNLLRNKGIEISESMVFGLGSGLFFVYLPFIKVNHAPAVSYRPLPGLIFNRVAKRLKIKVKRIKFYDKSKAQLVLEQNLENDIPSGLQVGVYHLTYFPDEYKFHFNAHNLVVYGKEGQEFLVSDPVMEQVTRLTERDLERVRFAKGAFAPKGQIYYPTFIPEQIDWEGAIKKAIKKTCNDMLAPVPIIGVRGMRMVAKSILKWPKKHGVRKANHYLAQMVRMQEEIGTGGGGFRFIYAAFLQEASVKLNNPTLNDLSIEMTRIGDLWRDFAVEAARVYKKRSNQDDVYKVLSDLLLDLADLEEQFFKKLKKAV
ncbi:BtrH N-terminal domain-containing protein [Flavobacterium sp. NKUCC04_CG]|uniref:BtrH N-terminal domain-containing protein n=1 Tax=Flavobacterium sp. NKUCC04_CG TaxID=2842121 RepID=UPI001C5B811E|nr:BtrH N-terminal domain-containing protein [Flavobacterium sp. NKUCC04_CG]MBW3518395.1 BtrH N-terminal domain-containing protein [Flavobacterium sp. NKUCC04_CG]